MAADLSGRLFYRDWAVVRADSTVGTLTVDEADPSTAITAFRYGSTACADPTRGAEFEGTGRLDTGSLTSFTVAACDNGPAGSGVDFFRMDVPPHGYSHGGLLSSGDVGKSGTEQGNHYYVTPSGSDLNPCTSSAPCFTMERVGSLLGPGDVAHFAPGTYNWTKPQIVSASGTANARVTYISDVKWGAKLVVSGTVNGVCGVMKNTGDHVDIVGFDMTVAVPTICANGLYQDGDSGRIIGNRVHDLTGPDGTGYGGIIVDCCVYTLTGNQVIGNVVDNIGPFLQGQSQSNLIHGIYVAGPNSVVWNNIVTRAAAACIELFHGATNEIVSNNTVANCGRYGIQIGADFATNDYTTVANNIVVNVNSFGGQYGFGIRESYNTGCNNVYYNNIVYNNRVNFDLRSCVDSSGNLTLTSAQFGALFVNYTGDVNGDYHLRSGAVAIGAGATNCAVGVTTCVPLTDFDGVTRPQGTAYDIGAYEALAAVTAADWSFDEGSGQTASDGSGNNNTATLGVTTAVEASDPLWVPGRTSNALQFDDTSSRVTVPGSPTVNKLADFTYAAWIYVTGSGGGTYGRIFSKETSTGFDDAYFLANTEMEASINNTVGTQHFSRAALNSLPWNTWSHVAVTYNDAGDRKLHLYLNGSEVGYFRQDVVSGTLRTTANTLIIGNRIAGDRSLQGKIDEAKVYTRALSAAEIQSLYNSGIP